MIDTKIFKSKWQPKYFKPTLTFISILETLKKMASQNTKIKDVDFIIIEGKSYTFKKKP